MMEKLSVQEIADYRAKVERDRKYIANHPDDFIAFAKFALKIKTKSGAIKPFLLNDAQKQLHEEVQRQLKEVGSVRILVLKGRQMGISTYIQALFYWLTSQFEGQRAFVLSHEASSTSALFEMSKRFYERCPDDLKPPLASSNVRELIFRGLDSGYKVGTASGTGMVGRGSTFTQFHGSETAFYPANNIGNLTTGCLQSVSDEPGTYIFLESTANGVDNYFHKLWNQASSDQSDYEPVFIPWFMQKEYRRGKNQKAIGEKELSEKEKLLQEEYGLDKPQLQWRRAKINELSVDGRDGKSAFCQEYPCNASEAFVSSGGNSLISAIVVDRARKEQKIPNNIKPEGSLVMSCDIARYGGDATVIARKQGRHIHALEVHYNNDTMQTAAILHNLLQKEKPIALFLDVCGLGVGVFDRLRELGHFDVLRPINGTNTPLDSYKYKNKRAEMYGVLGDALSNNIVQQGLPDDDQLQVQLCNVDYMTDSKGRIQLVSKDVLRAKGKGSPDRADAVSLLFAEPVYEGSGVFHPDIDLL